MIRRFAVVLALATLAGCPRASAPMPSIERVVGGERRPGRFVSPHAYEWFVRGELAFARGDYDAAVDAFELARTGSGHDGLVAARLAEALERAGEADEADAVLRDALRAEPCSEAAWMALGRIRERRGQFDAARGAYERAESCAPHSEAPPLALSRLLAAHDSPAGAHRVLARFARRARGGSPEAARARLDRARARGDVGAAVAAVDAWLRIAPARADEVRRVAELALSAGEDEIAARLLDRIPPRPLDHALRLEAYLRAGRLDAVEAMLAQTEPDAMGGHATVAELYLRAGHLAEAEELADAAVALARSPDAWKAAGNVMLARERWERAAAFFARVPSDVDAFAEARVGLARALSAQGLHGVAAEVLEEAAVRRPDEATTLRLELAERHRQRGDRESALQALTSASVDGDLRARASLARLLEHTGKLDEAVAIYRTFPRRSATLSVSDRMRGGAERLVDAGQLAEAVRMLTRLCANAPEDVLARARLAELLGRMGDLRRARANALSAITIEPSLADRLDPLLPAPTEADL